MAMEDWTTCERMMVATPPTPPVAPETRTGPLSGVTPPLSIAFTFYFSDVNGQQNYKVCVWLEIYLSQCNHCNVWDGQNFQWEFSCLVWHCTTPPIIKKLSGRWEQCLMQNNLDAKHCCVSCSSNLGSVLCCHSFRQRESPVCPASKTVKIWKEKYWNRSSHVSEPEFKEGR